MMGEDGKVKTINSLLDIERFSGEASTGFGPVIWFLTLSGAPILIYFYFFYGIIPIKYFLGVLIPWVIRVGFLTIGDESKRLDQFKRQLYDVYSSVYSIMDIKTIHKDGLIEYTNGRVAYLLTAYNSGAIDQIKRGQLIKAINTEIGRTYDFDIRGYNTNKADDLYRRYDGVKLFCDADVAKDFLAMIDYNRMLASSRTLMMMTVYCIYARAQDYMELRLRLEGVVKKPEAKAFRGLKIANGREVIDVLSEDIDTYVSIEELQREKYSSGNYYGSRVVDFDTYPDGSKKIESEEYNRGFMVKDR